jgi:hypothetical protein
LSPTGRDSSASKTHLSPFCLSPSTHTLHVRQVSVSVHRYARTITQTQATSDKQACAHARARTKTRKEEDEEEKTRAHTHGTSLTHYIIHTHVSRVAPKQGQEKPKFTSFQLIILSACQPIGLYYLFTLYRCAPISLPAPQAATHGGGGGGGGGGKRERARDRERE